MLRIKWKKKAKINTCEDKIYEGECGHDSYLSPKHGFDHRVDSVLGFVLIGTPPPPHPQVSVSLPLVQGGHETLACERERGGPNSE
jgi:hypothetical protein